MSTKSGFLSSFFRFVAWSTLVSKQIIFISPFQFLMSIVLSLFSQLAMVISFFLPLKVVFLIGSDSVPAYFNAVYSFSSIDSLILTLVIFSIVAYFVFLAGNHYSEQLSFEGAKRVVASTSKLAIFQNQEELARRTYLRLANVLAAALFFVASVVFFFFVYPSLFLIFVFCFLFFFGFLEFISFSYPRAMDNARTVPGEFASRLFGIFFIVIFVLMVVDLLFLSEVGVYVALACLLLIRQLLQRLTTASVDGYLLYSSKERINRIFLADFDESYEMDGANVGSVVSVLGDESSRQFVTDVLKRYVDRQEPVDSLRNLSVGFLQSSIIDIVMLSATVAGRSFAVKLFDARHQLLADREKDVLNSLSPETIGFSFHAIELSPSRQIHLFDFSEALDLSFALDFKSRRDSFRVRCFSMNLDDHFLKRYMSSHSFIWGRLRALQSLLELPIFESLFSSMSPRRLIDEVEVILKRLPLVFCPQDVTNDSLISLKTDLVTNLHWERWSIEPMGFGLTEVELDLKHLNFLIHSSGMREIIPGAMRLAGLSCMLEQRIKNQKFLGAKTIIENMIQQVEDLVPKKDYID